MAHEPHFVVKYSSNLGTAIKLVLWILYLPRRSGSVNIHRYSPPLRRIIVNYSEDVMASLSQYSLDGVAQSLINHLRSDPNLRCVVCGERDNPA